MKNVKKYLIIIMALVLVLTLNGCRLPFDVPTEPEQSATVWISESPTEVITHTQSATEQVFPTDEDTQAPDSTAQTATPAPEVTQSQTALPSQSDTALPQTSQTAPSVSDTVTPQISNTQTAITTPTATPTPTPTPTAKPTPTPTLKPTPSPTAKPTPTATQSNGAKPYCRTKLSTTMQSAYDKVVEALSSPSFTNGSMTVSINMSYTGDYGAAASKVVSAVIADHPEFFFLGNNWSLNYTSTKITSLVFNSTYTNTQIAAAKTSIANGVKYYTDKISSSLSEYEIALKLYELIATKVKYSTTGNDLHNIAGALINGVGVCESFAESYQYILNMYGIQAFTVTGQATNSSNRTENHMWVAAKINGAWYYIDPTWADLKSAASIADGKIRASYAYFAVTAAQIGVSHVLDDTSLFHTQGLSFTSTAANYHIVEGGYFTSCDQAAISSYIKKQIPLVYAQSNEIVSLRFSNQTAYEDAIEYLRNNVYSIYNSIPNKPAIDGMSYFSNNRCYVIDIWLRDY